MHRRSRVLKHQCAAGALVALATAFLGSPGSADVKKSITNKVTGFFPASVPDADVLVVVVATGIYNTRGSTNPASNITPDCESDRQIVMRLDESTPTGLAQTMLLKQVLQTAIEGPYRVQFSIEEGECLRLEPEGLSFPVATVITLTQAKRD